jgi:hypothetical protein
MELRAIAWRDEMALSASAAWNGTAPHGLVPRASARRDEMALSALVRLHVARSHVPQARSPSSDPMPVRESPGIAKARTTSASSFHSSKSDSYGLLAIQASCATLFPETPPFLRSCGLRTLSRLDICHQRTKIADSTRVLITLQWGRKNVIRSSLLTQSFSPQR